MIWTFLFCLLSLNKSTLAVSDKVYQNTEMALKGNDLEAKANMVLTYDNALTRNGEAPFESIILTLKDQNLIRKIYADSQISELGLNILGRSSIKMDHFVEAFLSEAMQDPDANRKSNAIISFSKRALNRAEMNLHSPIDHIEFFFRTLAINQLQSPIIESPLQNGLLNLIQTSPLSFLRDTVFIDINGKLLAESLLDYEKEITSHLKSLKNTEAQKIINYLKSSKVYPELKNMGQNISAILWEPTTTSQGTLVKTCRNYLAR